VRPLCVHQDYVVWGGASFLQSRFRADWLGQKWGALKPGPRFTSQGAQTITNLIRTALAAGSGAEKSPLVGVWECLRKSLLTTFLYRSENLLLERISDAGFGSVIGGLKVTCAAYSGCVSASG